MNSYETDGDLFDNPSTRCPCIVVLDTSGSMGGEPIRQLNQGIELFISSVKEDEIAASSVEISVITAGNNVTEVLPFTSAEKIEVLQQFSATGYTPLGEAVELALMRLEQRKEEYKSAGVSYYQPWLVIISDGVPTDSYEQAANTAKTLSSQGKLVVLPLGVDGADLDILDKFSSRGAKKLNGLKFKEFFAWLSASMSRVSASASTTDQVKLPSTDSWDSI